MFEIRRTRQKGRGLYATQLIPAGTVIAVCPVVVYRGAHIGMVARTPLGDYGFRWGADKQSCCIVLGVVSLCNHDEAPTAEVREDLAAESMTLMALRAIEPGQEITIRYRRSLWFAPAA